MWGSHTLGYETTTLSAPGQGMRQPGAGPAPAEATEIIQMNQS